MNLFKKSLLALAFLPSALFAQKSRPVVEVVPFGQYSWVDNTFNAENRGSVGVEFGLFATRNLELQVSATPKFFQDAPRYTPVDAHLVWNFAPRYFFSPLLGVGGVRERIGSTTVDGASGLAGMRIGTLKVEGLANYLPDLNKKSDFQNRVNYSARVGLALPFGSRPERKREVVVVAPSRPVVGRTVVVTDTVKITKEVTKTVTPRKP